LKIAYLASIFLKYHHAALLPHLSVKCQFKPLISVFLAHFDTLTLFAHSTLLTIELASQPVISSFYLIKLPSLAPNFIPLTIVIVKPIPIDLSCAQTPFTCPT